MQLNLFKKTALVTGSSKGIGLAIAQALHAEGCQVALNGRNSEDLSAATQQLTGSIGIVGDVTQPAQARNIVSEVLNTFGQLDILVCSVGSGKSAPPGNETAEEWQRVFSLNLWSATNTVEAAREALAKTKGVIVCITSICGLEVVPGAPVIYSAAKAALHAYVRGIARPLGRQGIRINALAPGNILFDGSVWSDKMAKEPQVVKQIVDSEVALGRLGIPSEVASLVLYLASSEASFATGGIWALDGGQVRA